MTHYEAAKGALRCGHRHYSVYAASNCPVLGEDRPGVVERDADGDRVVQHPARHCIVVDGVHLCPAGWPSVTLPAGVYCRFCPRESKGRKT